MGKSVDLEWHGNPPVFFCPVCGKDIVTQEGPAENWCSHVKFLYIPEVGEFTFNDENYKSLLTKKDYIEADEEDEDILEKLLAKIESASLLVLNLTTNGIGCGPVSMTVSYGVDFDPKILSY